MKNTKYFLLSLTIILSPTLAQFDNFQAVGNNAQELKVLPAFGVSTKSQDQGQLKSTVDNLSDTQIKEIQQIDDLYAQACMFSAQFQEKAGMSQNELSRKKGNFCNSIIATSGSKIKDLDLATKIVWYVPLYVKDIAVDLGLSDSSLKVLAVNNNQKFLDTFSDTFSKCYKEQCGVPDAVKALSKFMAEFMAKIEEAQKKSNKREMRPTKPEDVISLP